MEAGNGVLKTAQGKTVEKLGEIAGVGKSTIQNTETILTKGTPADIQEVRDGKASISGKAKEIKARDKPTEPLVKEELDIRLNSKLEAVSFLFSAFMLLSSAMRCISLTNER